jgi:N-formylglutamate deformylase
MNYPFYLSEAIAPVVPIILSSPHSGIEFPEEIKTHFHQEMIEKPDDTDWFVHELYNFAPKLGITMIHAKYSRWIIDLNRSPESVPLYDDGRLLTELVPKTDFGGNELYRKKEFIPDEAEIERRKQLYYFPYYRKLEQLLTERIERFGQVLLWDAHSIRRFVPTIQKEPFPDLILGSNDGKSAGKEIVEIALKTLERGKFSVSHNRPFKGGNITRHFGRPERKIHALQLEMSKNNYMNDDELTFNEKRADEVRKVLGPVFERLSEFLMK